MAREKDGDPAGESSHDLARLRWLSRREKLAETQREETTDPPYFKHRPIDTTSRTIRLIKVQQGPRWPRCKLYHASLSSSYDCLSYRWGNDEPTKKILINGGMFLVRENLYQFLQVCQWAPRLRERPIWIDAICIDQSNNTEKNHQVKQMGQLYASASSVHIWLGSRAHGGSKPFDFLLFSNPYKFLTPSGQPRSQGNDRTAEQRDALLSAMRNVAFDQYWRRAWVIQEIALAKERSIWLGSNEVSWERFCRIINPFVSEPTPELEYEEVGSLLESPLSAFVRTNTEHETLKGRPLQELIQLHSTSLECSDPRDRIYSLLSLVNVRTKLTADYSLSIDEVFYDALRECITEGCICALHSLVHIYGDHFSRLKHHGRTTKTRYSPSMRDRGASELQLSIRGTKMLSWEVPLDTICDELFFHGWILHCLPCRLDFIRGTDGLWSCSSCWIVQRDYQYQAIDSKQQLLQTSLKQHDVTVPDPANSPDQGEGFTLSHGLILRMLSASRTEFVHCESQAIVWTLEETSSDVFQLWSNWVTPKPDDTYGLRGLVWDDTPHEECLKLR
jgi:hypothetical protein